MSNGARYIFAFALGATAGALVTWRWLDEKYTRILDAEAESFRAAISKLDKEQADTPTTDETPEPDHVEEDCKNYATTLAKLGYTSYGDAKEGLKNTAGMDDMYVITPDEFAELEDYETHSLTYYQDGVLTDEEDNPIDDIDELVGLESLESFGMYETDSVYVRNERLKTDYEILLDMRSYSDVHGPRPRAAEASNAQDDI